MERQAQMSGGERIGWIESVRVLAAIWVFVVHYIAVYAPEMFYYWNVGLPLSGLSGKFAMAMFLVLLGYFAAAKNVRKRELIPYLVKRYLQLCLPMLVVTGLVAVTRIAFEGAPVGDTLRSALAGSFLFRYTDLCTQAGCLRDFMLSAIVIAVLSGYRFTPVALLVAALAAFRIREIWVFIGLLGALVYHAQQLLRAPWAKGLAKVVFSPVVKLALVIVSFLIIRRPENIITYMLDGIACATVFMVLLHSPLAQRVLSWKPLASLGKVSFEFFLLHAFLFPLPHKLAQLCAPILPQGGTLWLGMALAAVLAFAASFGLHWLLGTRAFAWPFALVDKAIQKRQKA